MLQITPQHKIYLAVQPIDFRKGINKLIGVCREQLVLNPFAGSLFVFSNRKRNALKILAYDGQGFWLCMKRLSQGSLTWWPKSDVQTCTLSAVELNVLIYNGNPKTAQVAEDWRPILTDD